MSDQQTDPYGLEILAQQTAKALGMGGPEKLAALRATGQLDARARIAALLDPGSFQEMGLLAHSDRPEMYDRTAADGKIVGFGTIAGRTVMVSADDVTVLAGAGGRVGIAKGRKAMAYAIEHGYPCINIGTAGGARIPDIMGAVGMISMVYKINEPPRDRRTPYIATLMGECYGNPSWKAAEADVVIMRKGAVMAVSGPPVLEVATGERVSPEALGGWELHAKTTGQVDLFADTDEACLGLVRSVLSYLPSSAEDLPPVVDVGDPPERRMDDVLSLVPASPRKGYDMHKVLEMLVDRGSLLELRPYFDPSLITALARMEGYTVGILANNPMGNAGAMGPGACEKGTAFMVLCDSFHIPMVFLHDTPGFFVGKVAEERKMPLKIMTFLEALHHCTVPKVSVVVRKSYGMAHCNMVGGLMGADCLLAWPTADISFMSPGVAVNTVYGRKLASEADPEAAKVELIRQMERDNAPWDAAGLNLLDAVIDPRDTRIAVIQALRRARGSHNEGVRSKRLLASWPTMY